MNLQRPRLFPVVLAVLFLAAQAGLPLFAAEGGSQNLAEAPVGTLFRWVHFGIVFGALGYAVARYGPAFFRTRAEAISSAIAEASAAQAATEQHLREAEEKLQRLDQEVAELRAAAQRESAAEAERIRALAREEAEKIRRAAQAESRAAERAARMELKALAARAAVQRANALIRQKITGPARAAMFRAFLDNLARSIN